MPIFSHRPIYVCKYSNNRTLKINWAVRNITLIKSAGFYLSSGGFRSRKSFSAAQSKTNPTDNRANRKGNLACTRDTARLPWRTKRTDTIPRPASSQFSNKQQVVVNGITCWLVNNEKQLPRLSLSLSLPPSFFCSLSASLLARRKFYINLNDGYARLYLVGRGLPGDNDASPSRRIKRKILAPFCRFIKRSRERTFAVSQSRIQSTYAVSSFLTFRETR